MYANNTLSRPKRLVTQFWLSHNQAAQIEFRAIRTLQSSLHSQPTLAPKPEAFQLIQQRVTADVPTEQILDRQWKLWAIPLGLLIVAGILLWQALPPVITLVWSAQGQELTTFKVYRGLSNAAGPITVEDFILIDEVPADSLNNTYTFKDVPLLPGTQVVYRIDAVDEQGLLATTKTLASNGVHVLLSQVTLMIIGLFIIYVLWILLRQSPFGYKPQWHLLS